MKEEELPPLPARRFWTLGRLFILAGLLLGLAGFFGLKAVRNWQFRKTLASAEHLLKVKNYQGAALAARQALFLRPNDPGPLRIMVALAGTLSSPEVLTWQQRLCNVLPNDDREWLKMAQYALQFGEPVIADDALNRVSEGARNEPLWHDFAGAVAAKRGSLPVAEYHFKQALAFTPQEESRQLSLAAIQMLATDETVAAPARAITEKLAADSRFQTVALRSLVDDARRRNDLTKAEFFAKQLAAAPAVSLHDRLLVLEVLRLRDPKAFQEALPGLKARAEGSPNGVFNLMRWLNAQGLPSESISFYKSLPSELQWQMPIPSAAAEAFVAAKMWTDLKRVVSKEEWGGLEFLRRAYRARMAADENGRGRGGDFAFEWDRANVLTGGNLGSLTILARLAQSWGWQEEAAQVWWQIANKPLGQRDALKALFSYYTKLQDTAHLYDVSKRVLEVEPSNPAAKNNVVVFSLLLEKEKPEAYRLIGELREKFPDHPGIASTFALSKLKQGSPAEALAIMESLPAESWEDISNSLYYGLALAGTGRMDEARPLLTDSAESKKLLPEERALAKSALDGKVPPQ